MELESPSIFSDFRDYMDEINSSHLNKEYVTTLVIPDGVTVQAKVSLEDFLGRKEFILTINISKESDKRKREKREREKKERAKKESNKIESNKEEIYETRHKRRKRQKQGC